MNGAHSNPHRFHVRHRRARGVELVHAAYDNDEDRSKELLFERAAVSFAKVRYFLNSLTFAKAISGRR